MTKITFLALVGILTSCALLQNPTTTQNAPAPRAGAATDVTADASIKFPAFDRPADPAPAASAGAADAGVTLLSSSDTAEPVRVGGLMLQAIRVAAEDFRPRDLKLPPDLPAVDRCFHSQAAQDYTVVRQGDVFFVRIELNPERCGTQFGALDSGAKYAISKAGKILRRVLDGEPE